MAYKPSVVVYDSCVLYPFHLRNLLIQCAVDRLVEARWTDEIHQEWMRSVAADRPGLTVERLRATRDLMKSVLPEADVTGYAQHVPRIELPDPDDRHVVAAALAGGASLIVTWNLRHFPAKELARYGLGRQTPDDLLMRLHAQAPEALAAAAANARRNLTKPPLSVKDFSDALRRQRLRRYAAVIAGVAST